LNKTSKKILTLPLRIALITLIIGALFKIMHWPYSKELMFIGGISIGVLYIIRFFYTRPKSKIDFVKLAIVLLWVYSYLIKVFHLNNMPYVIEICLVVLLIWWFVEDGLLYFKSRKFKKKGMVKKVYYALVLLTIFLLLFGILFKLQHWPFGSELFILGILILSLILILDYYLIEKSL